MKKLHFLVFLVVSLVIAVVPWLSQAEIRSKTLTLSPFVVGFFFEGKQQFEDSPIYGLAAGYNFTERWGAEVVASHSKCDLKHGQGKDANIYN